MEHNDRQFTNMLAAAQARLAQHTLHELAEKTGAHAAEGMLLLQTLGRTVSVRLSDGMVQPPLSRWHTLTLLHYLDLADGTPPAGSMITFAQYQNGLVRGGGFDREVEQTVWQKLGLLPPDELERRCRALGAEILPSNADFCARFSFAPHYPLWLKIWFADADFPASGRLLTDASAPHNLTIEDAVTVGSLLLDALTGAQPGEI